MSSSLVKQSQEIMYHDEEDEDSLIISRQMPFNHLIDKQSPTVTIDKDAPSSDYWYHGRLDRFESEERLKRAAKPCSFLVRESATKTGTYALSYMASDNTISHYNITTFFGDYYFGGRQFDRLETIVSYYMHYSTLKEKETLVNPIAPPNTCKIERYCRALKSYKKADNSDELSFLAGDYLKVYHSIGDGEWFWAQLLRTWEFGLVNIDSIEEIEKSKLHIFEPWYFESITKEQAANILSAAGHCSFLVRPSEQSPGDYTLFFNIHNFVHRYRITQIDNKYFQIGNRDFDSISSIIERYKHEDLVDKYRLVEWNYTQQARVLLDHDEEYHGEGNNRTPDNNNSNSIEDEIDDDDDEVDDDEVDIDEDMALAEYNIDNNNHVMDYSNESEHKNGFDDNTNVNNNNNNNNTDETVTLKQQLGQLDQQPKQEEKLITIDVKSAVLAKNTTTTKKSSLNNQDIYANHTDNDLNETNKKRNSIGPDILSRKTDNITIKGYLNKLNEKTKKWKPYWFVLNSTERQLFYFANEKRIKEKGLIDLSYGLYYPIDFALFNRPYCFQIIIRTIGSKCLITHYLSAKDDLLFKEWSTKIRLLCNPIQLNKKIQIKSICVNNEQPPKHKQLQSVVSLPIQKSSPSSSISKNTSNSVVVGRQSLHVEHQQTNSNYFIERSLLIEIKEARNLFSLTLAPPSSNQIGKQLSAPPVTNSISSNSSSSSSDTSSNQQQIDYEKKEQFYKNYYFYCLILFNNDIMSSRTKLIQINSANTSNGSSTSGGSSKNSSSSSFMPLNDDFIWNEKYLYEDIPLDIEQLKIYLFATKVCNPSIETLILQLQQYQSQQQNDHNLMLMTSNASSGNSSSSGSLSLFNLINTKFKQSSTSSLLSSSSSSLLVHIGNTSNYLIGQLNIKLNDYLNNGLNEQWYKIEYNQKHSVTSNAQLRVKLRFNEEKILFNLNDYLKFNSYLNKSIKELSIIYDCICPSNERTELVNNLIQFYIYNCNMNANNVNETTKVNNITLISDSELKLLNILKLYLKYEIERCMDLNTLFRSTTLTTSLMDYYMRSKTSQYLQKSLYEPLNLILKQTKKLQKSFELDPSKLQQASSSSLSNASHLGSLSTASISGGSSSVSQSSQNNPIQTQLELNLKHFKQSLSILLKKICVETLDTFPLELIYLFQYIRQQVSLKWPMNLNSSTNVTNSNQSIKYARIYCISSFIFLRLICPSLLNLTINTPTSNATKTNASSNSNSSSSTTNANVNNGSLNLSNDSNSFIISNINDNERYIKLITKALQTLANLTECKESFMQPLSEYLNDNKVHIINFIDHISNYDDAMMKKRNEMLLIASISVSTPQSQHHQHLMPPSTSNTTIKSTHLNDVDNQNKLNLCKNLANLHRLFQSFSEHIKSYLKNSNTNSENIDAINVISVANDSSENLSQLIDVLNEITSKIEYLNMSY